MGEQTGGLRQRRWLAGCGIAAAAVFVGLVLLATAFIAFLKPKQAGAPAPMTESAAAFDAAGAPGAPPPAAPTGGEAMAGGAEARTAESAPLIGSVAHAAEARREIIYTAELTVEVNDVDDAVAEAQQAAKDVGGWLGGKTANVSDAGDKTATLTLRVASKKFDALMEQLRNLGDLRVENTRAEDVTRQLVDLEARLKNLRREEEVIAELFKRQGQITDVLQVEQELARVRGQIEQAQGEMNYLRENVAWSTITLTINTKPSKVEQQLRDWSAGYHVLNAWNTLVKAGRGIVTALIYFVIVLGPFVLALALIIWAIRARLRAKAPPA
jgi:acetolactate synthase small subunit